LNTGPCGGVGPLRSARSNEVKRAGYGEAPAAQGVIIPTGMNLCARARE
jgi:hypothetical protein